jgi:hypothetical protein
MTQAPVTARSSIAQIHEHSQCAYQEEVTHAQDLREDRDSLASVDDTVDVVEVVNCTSAVPLDCHHIRILRSQVPSYDEEALDHAQVQLQ